MGVLVALHIPDNLPLPSGMPPQTQSFNRAPVIVIKCIAANHQYFALFGQRAEDLARLFPTDGHLGAIDKELHVNAVVRDCHMHPLVGYVASIGVDGGHFVSTVSFEREENTGVTVTVFTYCPDAKQPTTVTGGIEALVIQTWKKKK